MARRQRHGCLKPPRRNRLPPPEPSASATPATASTYPVTVKTDRAASASEAAAARPALAREFAEVEQMEGHKLADYTVALADLNGDGRKDMIVQVRDFNYCGTQGCSAYAILATPSGFADKVISLGVNYYDTITVLPEATKGMHSMRYDDSDYTFRWNGKEYQ